MFDGYAYYLQTTGRYYQCGDKSGHGETGERLLHRVVWALSNGPIPAEHHIHHRNGDWTDNRLDNLECISAQDHIAHHAKELWADDEYRARMTDHLDLVREKAADWHRSKEGRAWHSVHGRATWENRETETVVCSVCGELYEAHFSQRSRFCSRSCEQKESYQRHKTAKGVCAWCGKAFTFNKYRAQKCCSRDCSNKLKGQEVKTAPPEQQCVVCESSFQPKRHRKVLTCSRSCAAKLAASKKKNSSP